MPAGIVNKQKFLSFLRSTFVGNLFHGTFLHCAVRTGCHPTFQIHKNPLRKVKSHFSRSLAESRGKKRTTRVGSRVEDKKMTKILHKQRTQLAVCSSFRLYSGTLAGHTSHLMLVLFIFEKTPINKSNYLIFLMNLPF